MRRYKGKNYILMELDGGSVRLLDVDSNMLGDCKSVNEVTRLYEAVYPGCSKDELEELTDVANNLFGIEHKSDKAEAKGTVAVVKDQIVQRELYELIYTDSGVIIINNTKDGQSIRHRSNNRLIDYFVQFVSEEIEDILQFLMDLRHVTNTSTETELYNYDELDRNVREIVHHAISCTKQQAGEKTKVVGKTRINFDKLSRMISKKLEHRFKELVMEELDYGMVTDVIVEHLMDNEEWHNQVKSQARLIEKEISTEVESMMPVTDVLSGLDCSVDIIELVKDYIKNEGES
jgi:hypothetical protein